MRGFLDLFYSHTWAMFWLLVWVAVIANVMAYAFKREDP